MNFKERKELKNLLLKEVDRFNRVIPECIIDNYMLLDEDSGSRYTTESEMLIFNLPFELIPALQVSYDAYEHLIGIASHLDDPLYSLIIKARSICPPAKFVYGEHVFALRNDNTQWYMWFAKEFMDIPNRAAYAFWHKRSFNLENLITYDDELPANKQQAM